ncbi:colanic acid/amylovoran biosynthesis glycosyltransferase [Dysgonomonas sp. PH5-45]|uniref:glycosyltransferase n=1 Tax=unclassified Dysgonomonas TaxID=2630389 RepID=UPI002474A92A|nr:MULTISPECIES: glycosyltransferase [unclassified Dysgonomonas]MDH6355295.1 colanic acid/amylovoran biosynthesis glycosyltransferase [Dysgonomonas sp. PH5-45]MDH6388179.1 colanic acid/amylovoran biosynthesis glycosyltransferase [Dysgonomonas sp. PH5-37]
MKKKLKIAYVVSGFPELSETFICNQIADMIDRGYDITIYATHKPSPPYHKIVQEYKLEEKTTYYSELSYTKFKLIKAIINLMSSSLYTSWNILKYIFGRKFLKHLPIDKKMFILGSEIKKSRADIIHVHFAINGVEIAKLKKWGVFKTSKLVTAFHGYDIQIEELYPGTYIDLYEQCEIFTVNSEYSKKLIVKTGCPLSKIRMLPVGLNVDNFKPTNRDDSTSNKPLKIIFIGRLIEFKAPDLVVEICRLLVENKISFTCKIIGRGALLPQLSEMINEYKLTDRVELMGGQTQEQIIDIMNQSDVFLLPGIYDKTGRAENQGLVIQEAQAMELPVIVSNVGGMPEGLIDGKTGFVVNEYDLEGFVEKLKYLAENKDERIRMGRNARKYVEENFSSKLLGDRLEDIY